MTGPTRATVAGRVYLDLQNKARREQRPTQELLELYVLEGFLARLAEGNDRDTLVLKGGVLLAAYGTRRATRDVDFLATELDNDRDVVLQLCSRIAGAERNDGLDFDFGSARAELIRDDDEYSGVRVSMRCELARAQISFHIDVKVGDPVWPAPGMVEVPALLGGSIRLLGYPITAVHAEKVVTAIQRGTANTRWRDFADIYLLNAQQDVDGDNLIRALTEVAIHRGAQLIVLRETLQGYPELAQTRWTAWVRRQTLIDRLPGEFGELLESVYAFADPAIRADVAGHRWDHLSQSWRSTDQHP